MTGIIVCGHGHFAKGLTSALHLIMGEQDNYIAVDFPSGDTKTELEKKHLSSCCAIKPFRKYFDYVRFT